jgi:hypothetical protein
MDGRSSQTHYCCAKYETSRYKNQLCLNFKPRIIQTNRFMQLYDGEPNIKSNVNFLINTTSDAVNLIVKRIIMPPPMPK